jgi:hypothetical protein
MQSVFLARNRPTMQLEESRVFEQALQLEHKNVQYKREPILPVFKINESSSEIHGSCSDTEMAV